MPLIVDIINFGKYFKFSIFFLKISSKKLKFKNEIYVKKQGLVNICAQFQVDIFKNG